VEGCEFHALDALHGDDEHPVSQVNLELLANQKLSILEADVMGSNSGASNSKHCVVPSMK